MSVRRYIRIKAIAALIVSVLCGAVYGLLRVDLYFVFAIATFVLCFVPHIGNTLAVLAPLPLVFLDPDKTYGDLVACFILPFVVHQLSANLFEPKFLAKSLELHPVVVLLSLSFWASIWGAVGAILSVPLTAVLRMILLASDHPYATAIAQLLVFDTVTVERVETRRSRVQAMEEIADAKFGHPLGDTSPVASRKSKRGSPHTHSRSPRARCDSGGAISQEAGGVRVPRRLERADIAEARQQSDTPVGVSLDQETHEEPSAPQTPNATEGADEDPDTILQIDLQN